MNKEELAARLNGRDLCRGGRIGVGPRLRKKIGASGLVVVFGYSDCCVEFWGLDRKEVINVVVSEPKSLMIRDGAVLTDTDGGKCSHCGSSLNLPIIAVAYSHDRLKWTINTTIPHALFQVKASGLVYSDGIVFSVQDLPAI